MAKLPTTSDARVRQIMNLAMWNLSEGKATMLPSHEVISLCVEWLTPSNPKIEDKRTKSGMCKECGHGPDGHYSHCEGFGPDGGEW